MRKQKLKVAIVYNEPQPEMYRKSSDPNPENLEFKTYFEVDEGRLFGAGGGQFIRTATKRDQIDLIERIFRLSNDTGRYCRSGNPRDWQPSPCPGSGNEIANECKLGLTNPVEVCGLAGECFGDANIERTCMDTDNNLIFIRSKIKDLRGRKWVTPMDDDPYVRFRSVPVP